LRALLDTHVLLYWLGDSSRLSKAQRQLLETATEEAPLLLSDISLWEIATLCSLGRISLTLPLRDWLEQAVAYPLVERVSISPAIAAEVAALPDSFHRDPSDRIIVASARIMGATLLTSDRRIIDAELVPTLP
jgi:PIN domain nuclease of toxin-antitoxin system